MSTLYHIVGTIFGLVVETVKLFGGVYALVMTWRRLQGMR